MMKRARLFAAATILLLTGGADVAPPQCGPGQPAPVAHPYDAPGVAHRAVDAAFAKARAEHKRVLIDFGANWCADCRMLAGVVQLAPVQAWIAQNFEPVSVNVDHFNVNMDLAQRYGITVKAIPTVLIVTPEGRVLNPDGTLVLGNARHMSSQAVVDQIASWDARS